MHVLFRPCALLLMAMFLGGCATVSSFKGIALDDDTLFVSGLPPIRQDKNYACGAACLASVSAFWGIPLAEFKARIPTLTRETTGQDMQVLGKKLGLQAFAYRGSLEDIKDNLRRGRPLMVMIPQPLIPDRGLISMALINAWDNWGPKSNHWVVVVGLTTDSNVIIHDPASGPMTVKLDAFQRWWAKKGNLTVLLAAG